jgi:hypothetical protein
MGADIKTVGSLLSAQEIDLGRDETRSLRVRRDEKDKELEDRIKMVWSAELKGSPSAAHRRSRSSPRVSTSARAGQSWPASATKAPRSPTRHRSDRSHNADTPGYVERG